jgi:hypothetical protein
MEDAQRLRARRRSSSEKLVAIDFESGKPVQVSGQSGGVYPPRSP